MPHELYSSRSHGVYVGTEGVSRKEQQEVRSERKEGGDSEEFGLFSDSDGKLLEGHIHFLLLL